MPLDKHPVTDKSPVPELTDSQFQELVKKALDARDLSYSPYSHFRVGACILASDGEFIVGANIENASYPASICAERTAIVKAMTSGHKKFSAIAVSTDSTACSSPCGVCRQVIREFTGPELTMPLFMLNNEGTQYVMMTVNELLPLSFGPEDLKC